MLPNYNGDFISVNIAGNVLVECIFGTQRFGN